LSERVLPWDVWFDNNDALIDSRLSNEKSLMQLGDTGKAAVDSSEARAAVWCLGLRFARFKMAGLQAPDPGGFVSSTTVVNIPL
jgi:hypothetical protein